MADNTQKRIDTKQRAISALTQGPMNKQELAARMTEYNGWKIETNIKILTEMEISKRIDNHEGIVRLSR